MTRSRWYGWIVIGCLCGSVTAQEPGPEWVEEEAIPEEKVSKDVYLPSVFYGLLQGTGYGADILGPAKLYFVGPSPLKRFLIPTVYTIGLIQGLKFVDRRYGLERPHWKALNNGFFMGAVHGFIYMREQESYQSEYRFYTSYMSAFSLLEGLAMMSTARFLNPDIHRVRAWQAGNFWGTGVGLIYSYANGIVNNYPNYSTVDGKDVGMRSLFGGIVGMVAMDALHRRYPVERENYYLLGAITLPISLLGFGGVNSSLEPTHRDFAVWGAFTMAGLGLSHLMIRHHPFSQRSIKYAASLTYVATGITFIVAEEFLFNISSKKSPLFAGMVGLGTYGLSTLVALIKNKKSRTSSRIGLKRSPFQLDYSLQATGLLALHPQGRDILNRVGVPMEMVRLSVGF